MLYLQYLLYMGFLYKNIVCDERRLITRRALVEIEVIFIGLLDQSDILFALFNEIFRRFICCRIVVAGNAVCVDALKLVVDEHDRVIFQEQAQQFGIVYVAVYGRNDHAVT